MIKMTDMKQYKNASLIACGAMCTILMGNSLAGSSVESMEAGSEVVDTAVGRGNVNVLHL